MGLKDFDFEISEIIKKELDRQRYELNMIPSENYCSSSVLEVCGSVLNNKYAEGYPKKRYYQGNKFVDDAEILAIERAKMLFGAEHVNVQPNSGSPANMAVYLALLETGDKILGMDLTHGGHLTHGSKVNFSGKLYNFVYYGVDENGYIDMKKVREIAERERPKLIICGATAYPRKIDFKNFAEIAKSVSAISMADISHIAGLVAGGVHESPFPHIDIVTTTTHKTLRGPRGAIIMCKQQFASAIDKAVFPGIQGGPHEHIIAAKAVCFGEALKNDFKIYSEQIVKNSKALAKTLVENGIVLVSGGTDNHLILIDLEKTLGEIGKGKEVAVALEEAGIITNANTIPFEKSSPFKPSGIRIGVPILTTRGMKESEMKIVGKYISDVIKNSADEKVKQSIKEKVRFLCERFVFY
jgi:glycine hydroxymethyltransferase